MEKEVSVSEGIIQGYSTVIAPKNCAPHQHHQHTVVVVSK